MTIGRWLLTVLAIIGCSVGASCPAASADPISECLQTGSGTYMEGHWNLVPELERFRVCHGQETDRQRSDRLMKQWQEEQRQSQTGSTPGKAEQQATTKGSEEPSRSRPAASADPISECMQTGRGTYMEGRWNLVPEPERFRLCRDQETDRLRSDRAMKQWQEEQRLSQTESTPGKAERQATTKGSEEPSRQPLQSEGDRAGENYSAPCARPDVIGECEATPDQILYQIKRSKETGGETNR